MSEGYLKFYKKCNKKYDKLVKQAAALAKKWHKGQVDKAGVDYFKGHLTTVGSAGFSWQQKVVGYLHDVAEDTPHTVTEIIDVLKEKSDGLLSANDANEIATALNLLNSKTANSREEYIARIKENFVAAKVKLIDLRHNMDISRLPHPTDEDLARIERYKCEYEQISAYFK
ncbi:MAG: phosphohydrolase [Prevotellaceae bacterium]|nr:phosphohydrolase [Prevotellaceae bacterium]